MGAVAAALLCALCIQWAAACPFAHLHAASGGRQLAAHDGGRKLLQQPPGGKPPGGGGGPQRPPLKRPPLNPPPRTAPCDIASLVAAGPYVPAGPVLQGQVDQRIKDTAWAVITSGSAAGGPGVPPTPGVGQPGSPNTALPLGALLRFAFHDAGTYDRAKKTGGANGSIRLELATAVRNMRDAARLVDSWRRAINARLASDAQVPAGTAISYADTVQLAGAAAVIATGLSKDALWKPLPVGRVDSPPLSASAAASSDNTTLLPPATLDFGQLACLFLANGYTLDELVALSGAHSIGFRQTPPVAGTPPSLVPLTATPSSFDTDYYSLVLAGSAAFRTDNSLRDPRTLATVQKFAANQAAFHTAFASAYIKMSKMGASWKSYGAALKTAKKTG